MPLHEFGRSLSMTTAVKSKLQLPFFKLVWLYLYFIYISIDYIQWQRVWFLHDWIDLNVNPQSQCIHAQRFLFQNWEGKCWASYLFSKIYCIYSLGQFSGHISKFSNFQSNFKKLGKQLHLITAIRCGLFGDKTSLPLAEDESV